MALTQRFRAAAEQAEIPLMPSLTPIQPVLLGDSEAALAASQQLFAAGFWVTAIRPPTVPRGEARLRVTLSAAHTDTQVDALVDALRRAVR
jgi:8-amino-7-oxononanoate synthase